MASTRKRTKQQFEASQKSAEVGPSPTKRQKVSTRKSPSKSGANSTTRDGTYKDMKASADDECDVDVADVEAIMNSPSKTKKSPRKSPAKTKTPKKLSKVNEEVSEEEAKIAPRPRNPDS